jgi:hypothetical protein
VHGDGPLFLLLAAGEFVARFWTAGELHTQPGLGAKVLRWWNYRNFGAEECWIGFETIPLSAAYPALSFRREGLAGTKNNAPPELGGVVALPQVAGLHHLYERRLARRHSTAGSGFFGQTSAPASGERMCFFCHRTIATFGAGRFRSANPSAAGLLELNFRISDTHLQQIEIGVGGWKL